MNRKMLITLGALAGALVVLVVLLAVLAPALKAREEQQTITTAQATTTTPAALGTRNEQEVLKVTVKQADGSFTFIRDSYLKEWTMEGEAEVQLNQSMVSSLVSHAAAGLVSQDIKSDLNDLEQYGLAQPKSVVTITFSDGESQTYCIGDLTVEGNGCYGYQEGVQRLVLLPGNFYSYAVAPLYSFVEPRDFTVSGAAITYFNIMFGDKVELEAQKLDEGTMSVESYQILQPYHVLAGTEFTTFAEYFTNLSLSGQVDVRSDDLAKYGLDKPAYTITAKYDPANVGGTGDFTLYVGNLAENEEDYYVAFEGEQGVYTIKKTTLDFITKMNVFNMTNRLFMMYSVNYVDKVELKTATEAAVLDITQNPDDDMVSYTLDGNAMERKAAGTWYQTLISISSHGVLPQGYTVSGQPEMTVTFTFLPDNIMTQRVFEFYPYEKDYYAVSIDGVADFYCRRDKVSDMLEALADLRSGAADETKAAS